MYNLFVTASEGAWEKTHYEYDRSRFLEFTLKEFSEKYRPLTAALQTELISFPSLFAYEKIVSAPAKLGWVRKIKLRTDEIRIEFEIEPHLSITHEELTPLLWDLDIDEWEMNRTHWAVKDVDLAEALKSAGKFKEEQLRGMLSSPSQIHPIIPNPSLEISTKTVEQALKEAESLTREHGAASGVDRIHTAFHGYLRAVCQANRIPFKSDATLTELFKTLRANHPKLAGLGPKTEEINKTLRGMSSIMDALMPIRNHASIAHPNEDLLEPNEAMLVINITRTMLHYLNKKFSNE